MQRGAGSQSHTPRIAGSSGTTLKSPRQSAHERAAAGASPKCRPNVLQRLRGWGIQTSFSLSPAGPPGTALDTLDAVLGVDSGQLSVDDLGVTPPPSDDTYWQTRNRHRTDRLPRVR